MPRLPQPRTRIGANERRLINTLRNRIKNYRIFKSMRRQRETSFNSRLMDYLRQEPDPLEVSNWRIPAMEFIGETFRPEFFLQHRELLIAAVECKKLTDKTAKARWKEGLSQALLYSAKYKATILVLLDFTTNAKYHRAFGRGNSVPTRFARRLRETNNIYVVALRPYAD